MKKLFLGLGAVAAVVTPVVAVVSCGDKSSSKEANTPAQTQQQVVTTEHQQQAATPGTHTGSTHANANSKQALPTHEALLAMPAAQLAKAEFVIDNNGKEITFDHWGIITEVTADHISFRSVFENGGNVNDFTNKISPTADISNYKLHDHLLDQGLDLTKVHVGDFITNSAFIVKQNDVLKLQVAGTYNSFNKQTHEITHTYTDLFVPRSLVLGISFKA